MKNIDQTKVLLDVNQDGVITAAEQRGVSLTVSLCLSWLSDWLVSCMTDWLIDWISDWLADWLRLDI